MVWKATAYLENLMTSGRGKPPLSGPLQAFRMAVKSKVRAFRPFRWVSTSPSTSYKSNTVSDSTGREQWAQEAVQARYEVHIDICIDAFSESNLRERKHGWYICTDELSVDSPPGRQDNRLRKIRARKRYFAGVKRPNLERIMLKHGSSWTSASWSG